MKNIENEDNISEKIGSKTKSHVASNEIYDWAETFVFALCVVVLLFTFLFRIVTVDGHSMQQTLQDKEKLLISKLAYSPEQGDIIVLQKEENYDYPLVKRVIATEGQVVDIDFENWKVTVDSVELYEPYVNFVQNQPMNRGNYKYPYTVSEGCVFVMGDNRNKSSDSRYFGEIDSRKILGKVLIRLLPLNKFGTVKPAVS